MQISVTFRRTDSSQALKDYAVKKLTKLKKYLNASFEANVILSVSKNKHCASVNISSNNGINIQGEERNENMYSAIDVVTAKLERQIKKHREKLRNYTSSTAKMAKLDTYSSQSVHEHEGEADKSTVSPIVIKSEDMAAEYLTVEEAVMKLDFQQKNFLVFTNKDSNKVSILYERTDGNYGIIEP